MTQYTDKLHGNLSSNERILELCKNDLDIIVNWYAEKEDVMPTFKDLYFPSVKKFIKSVSLNPTKKHNVFVMKTDIENAIYWAELNDIENSGADLDKEMLKYLQKVLKNEHLEELKQKMNNSQPQQTTTQSIDEKDDKCCENNDSCCKDPECGSNTDCCKK